MPAQRVRASSLMCKASRQSTISFSGIQANAQITFTDYFNTTVSAQVLAGTVSEYEYKF